jgi:hypothetical protein
VGQIPRNLQPPAERNHAENAEQRLVLRARPLPGWL